MPKIDEMQLKKEIKSGDFKNAYLLYGEESYLKEYYANELKNKIVDKTFEAFANGSIDISTYMATLTKLKKKARPLHIKGNNPLFIVSF